MEKYFSFDQNDLMNKEELINFIKASSSPIKRAKTLAHHLINIFMIYEQKIYKYDTDKDVYYFLSEFHMEYLLMMCRKYVNQSTDLLTDDEKAIILHNHYYKCGDEFKNILNMEFYKDIQLDLCYLLCNEQGTTTQFKNSDFLFDFTIEEKKLKMPKKLVLRRSKNIMDTDDECDDNMAIDDVKTEISDEDINNCIKLFYKKR